MIHSQAYGMLLIAVGAVVFFLVTQLWARSKRDPLWILRGEFRELIGPSGAHVLNAALLVGGVLLGAVAVGGGLMFLRWL